MKLLSLSTTYPESQNSSAPRFVHELNKELVNLGFDITAIVPHQRNFQTFLKMDSVNVRFFKYLPEKFEMSGSIPDEIKSFKGKIKLIIMTLFFFFSVFRICFSDRTYILHGNWAFPSGYIAYLISKLFNKKFIVTIHGSEIPLLEKLVLIKPIVISSLNSSYRVVTSNNFLKKKLIHLGVLEEKIELIRPIPNFINHNLNQNELKEFRKRITEPSNKIILFVGRLTEVKGTEYLIKSFPKLKTKNTHLIIVGDGVLLEPLKQLSKKLKIEKTVTFFGPANRTELAHFYQISDVFVMPSIIDSSGGTEGTGLVIPEAMKFGIPVVASKVGGISETIIHEENGLLVNQKDPTSIAEAIDRIISDDKLSSYLIKNSTKTVKEFLPSEIAKKYQEIFNNIKI